MSGQTFYNLLCDEDERGMFTQAGHYKPAFKQPKLEISGPNAQIIADWLEGKSLKRLPTDHTP